MEELPIQPVTQKAGGDHTKRGNCCKTFFKISCNSNLIKFKAFFFFFGGAIGSVFPYFSIFYKQIGFSPNQIGIISGLRPVIGVCCGSFWGAIADRFRIRRIVLVFSALAWLGFITSIGFVPTPRQSDDQCVFVNEILKTNVSQDKSLLNANNSYLRQRFYNLHKPRDDVSASEGLLESRGWMFDAGSLDRAFITILLLVLLGELFQAPCGALADSGCIEYLGNKNFNDYGKQRAWGSLGICVFSLLAGAVVNLTRHVINACGVDITHADYRIAFYFFAGTMSCCVITTFFFRFQKQADAHASSKPRPNPLLVLRMFATWHYSSWLFSMFITGVCNGVIWGFLFWHLENIGATQLLLGVANSVSLLSEMIMFLVVFWILERSSCLTFMTLGMLGYTVRFVVFALIDNPWLVIPFEVLQGCTFAGVWSVFTKYLCYNVPSEYLGTLQGFLHGVYWGLGAGTGNLLGGILVQTFGARVTFWVFAVTSFLNCVMFVIIQRYTTRPDVFGVYDELEEEMTTQPTKPSQTETAKQTS